MTPSYDTRSRDGGVSESIGFLLIFTLVIVGIGLVTLYGYPMLLQQQVSADEQIMEKNMIVLQNDLKSLAYKTVPYKETSLKIGGGALTVNNPLFVPATSTISISDDNFNNYVTGFSSGDLRYVSTSARTDISLQNGAVVKRDRAQQGSVMLAEPRWFYDSASNTMIISLISINSTTTLSRAGIGTVQMALQESNYSSYTLPINVKVTMDYTHDTGADFSTAWNSYFVNTLNMQKTGTAGATETYRLPFDPARPAVLVIKKYDVLIKSV